MKFKILLALTLLFSSGISFGQYTDSILINNTLTPQVLVQDSLISGCVSAFNVTFAGDNSMIGYFSSPSTCSFDTIMSSGIILASGPVTNAIGPNNSGSISQGMNVPGDVDLNALIPQTTNDAAVLEFDFVPSSDTLQFKYVFGSDEYLEYVNSSFNDVFAFFLSGPNPAGGAYVNENIAIVPGTAIPVSINNVNNVSNSSYYINNGTGSTPNHEALQYDGYTIGMYAVAIVVPCETYHIKLAVADAGDSALDSGVFIEAGSFTDGTSVTINNVNPAGTLNDLYEGCESYYVFTRQDTTDISFPVEILLSFSGTAVQDSDITVFPSVVTIPIGQISDTIYYTAYMDGLEELTETFIIEILAGCPCNPSPAADTITIYDYVEFKASIINTDSMFCGITPPPTYDIISTCVSHPPWFIDYLWNTGSTDSIITVVPPLPGQHDIYWVEISDLCGNTLIDSITIGVSDLSGITVTSTDALCYQVCNGTVSATPLGTVGGLDFVWSEPSLGITPVGNLYNLCAGNYVVTVTDDSYCEFHQSFSIGQPNATLDPSSGILPIDTAYCVDPGVISINAFANIPDVYFSWNGATATSSTLDVNPAIGLNIYFVDISDFCGFTVSDTVSIYVSSVQNSNMNIENTTCYDLCDGSVNVQANGIPPFIYQWGSNNSGSFTSSENALDSLCIDTFYLNVIDDVGCVFTTDFYIEQPDSFNVEETGIQVFDTIWCGIVPPTSISLEGYCNLPDANYLWSTGSTDQNLFVTPTQGTAIYSVTISDNCGNSKVDQVSIIVSNMNGITSFVDTTSCYNSCDGYVSIVPQGGLPPFNYEWSGGVGTPTSGDIFTLCQGVYDVTVSDSGGCIFTNNFEIQGPDDITECNITNQTTMYCGISAPASITLNTWINSDISYVWNTGATTNQIDFTPVTGANIYWVDFSDQCGNTYRDTIIISVSNFSGALVETMDAVCFSSCNGQVEVTPLGGISPFTYYWDIAGTTPGGDNLIDNICAGIYNVTVNDLALCSIVKEFTITQPDSVEFEFISSASNGMDCNGFASAINVVGGIPPYTYLWDDDNSTTTYNVSGLCPGLYTVIVEDDNNCTYSDTVRVLDSTVGIESIDIDAEIQVFPNPNSDGIFILDLGRAYQEFDYLQLFNATGKEMFINDVNSDSQSITIENIPVGITMLRIVLDDGSVIIRKLVVID